MNRKQRRNKLADKTAKKIMDLIFKLNTKDLYNIHYLISEELFKRDDFIEINDSYSIGGISND